MMITHCQVCGRAIKTVVGRDSGAPATAPLTHVIAAHGFRRPWQQHYQTASCFGARWRP